MPDRPLILYAEDDAFQRDRLIAPVLKHAGCDVICCENGEDALQTLKCLLDAARHGTGKAPDLLLTDNNMPKMTGEKLIESVRNLPADILPPNFPIVMYADLTLVPKVQPSVEAKGVKFVPKSPRTGELIAAVAEGLQKAGKSLPCKADGSKLPDL